MNAYERVMAALALKPSDRVPVVPEIIQHALNVFGVTHSDYSTNPAAMVKTIIAARERYGYDAVYVSSDNFIYAEAFGGKLLFPVDDAPQLVIHPLDAGLPASLPPFDLSAGRMRVILEATRLLRAYYGDLIFIKTNIDSAPFSALASLRGPQKLMTDLYDEPDTVRALLWQCTDAVIRYGLEAAKAGAHGLAFGDSVSGLLNREMYGEFALPCAREAVRVLREQTGLPVFYHVCGNTNHILDLMLGTGADCLELDSLVDMKDALPLAKGKCALEGNIDTVNVLFNGSTQDVRRAADRLLALFGRKGGFILSSACEIPRNTPCENVLEITRAALEYPYPD